MARISASQLIASVVVASSAIAVTAVTAAHTSAHPANTAVVSSPAANSAAGVSGTALKRSLLTSTVAALSSPTKPLYFGLTIGGVPTGDPHSMSPLIKRESQLHQKATIVSYFQSWAAPFDPLAATNIWNQGALPMLSWDPYQPAGAPAAGDAGASGAYEPNWTLAQDLSGRYDSYIRATAKAMAALPFPIALRMAHEQNGNWFPWGIALRNPQGQLVNSAALYRKFWRHVWTIFQQERATNVIFVWSPNAPSAVGPNLTSTYPGNKYVDWVGMSAYLYRRLNWSYIGNALSDVHKIAPTKPIVLTETGVGATTDNAKGISRIASHITKQPGVAGWVYLDTAAGRTDWRFETHASTLAAMRNGLKGDRYYSHLPGR
jgi:mannan endo-1,4-beta-mannosidase